MDDVQTTWLFQNNATLLTQLYTQNLTANSCLTPYWVILNDLTQANLVYNKQQSKRIEIKGKTPAGRVRRSFSVPADSELRQVLDPVSKLPLVDLQKVVRSTLPNLIHAVDGAFIRQIIRALVEGGLTPCSMVHDCLGPVNVEVSLCLIYANAELARFPLHLGDALETREGAGKGATAYERLALGLSNYGPENLPENLDPESDKSVAARQPVKKLRPVPAFSYFVLK